MLHKIIELKGSDWLKGISTQPNIPVGGLHQQLLGCDPFEDMGIALPSLSPVSISLGSVPKFLTNYNDGSGNGYVLAQSNSKLYRILKDSPYTVVDETSNITVVGNITNAIVWKSAYVYAQDTLRKVLLPNINTDAQMLSGWNAAHDYRAMCVGADGNLYVSDAPNVRSFTDLAGTNTAFALDTGFIARALVNDGRYLVIVADNNAILNANAVVGDYLCRIYFWDMIKTQNSGASILPDVIYDIKDSYIMAAKFLEGAIHLFGYNGHYVCNSFTPPKMLRPFVGTNTLMKGKPLNSAQVTVSKGSVFWVDGSTTGVLQGIVNAYGNPVTGQQKIYYQPYLNGGNSQQTCLQTVGDQYWMGNNASLIYVHNIGSTRGQVSIQTLDTTMVQSHKFEYTKVVLEQPLSSGQTVQHIAYGGNQSVTVSGSETRNYNSAAPKQELLFTRNGNNATQENFEDLSVTIVTTGGAAVQRISVYASPQEDGQEAF